jgi:hypothetical protein
LSMPDPPLVVFRPWPPPMLSLQPLRESSSNSSSPWPPAMQSSPVPPSILSLPGTPTTPAGESPKMTSWPGPGGQGKLQLPDLPQIACAAAIRSCRIPRDDPRSRSKREAHVVCDGEWLKRCD